MKKIITLLLLAPMLSACGFEIVDTGYRGVETRYGKVVSDSLEEGLYFYNPLTSDIIEMDVRTQTASAEDYTYTKDVQQAKIAYTANFNLDKTKAHMMYQEVGRDWQETLVPQIIQGSMKNVIGKWNAVDLIANREKATAEIEASIRVALAEKNITVSKFEITNIDYADEFEKAVEAKVTAVERAKEAENKTKQVEEEAKQKVIAAKAEAESMQIRAEALTQNKALVDYEAVQKWDGKLPITMLGNSIPMINLSTHQPKE